MNLLAFDTSTDSMSIAVQRTVDGVVRTWQHTAVGGAQTSTRLIPDTLALLAQAELDLADLRTIAFGRGPGSFTGLRTACSVAQGLAFGAGISVLPIDSLLAVAEAARFEHAPQAPHWQVLALLDARMDELYAAAYVFTNGQWAQQQAPGLLRPEQLLADDDWTLAGNVFAHYGERLAPGRSPRLSVLPTASALLRLAPALLASGADVPPEQALPLYVRDKVAQTTLERAVQKAAALAGPVTSVASVTSIT